LNTSEKQLKLKELTEQFHSNIKQYKSNIYDEANTRVDFIDKFFELLDWDVRNIQGYSEQYREVVREDKVQIEGKQKAPDYSFRIGKERKFFVEAKKPVINIKDDIDPAFQIRRYGYTAKLPLSILTDFEEFAVYDTRIKPDKNDKASAARIFYCNYEEYEKNFEFIYNTFSKNAILKGSFDKYIEENKNKKGTGEVDKELLKLVEDWRTELAKNIALRNNDIDIYNLNNAVQKIIDRIIFLRIAEDKEIEPYEQLLNICNGKDSVYEKLNKIFIEANKKYNSGLFKPEEWLTTIKIDDKILSTIIKGLYYPECPYEFSILPIEILGNIYEQFLGKTIRFRNVKEGHTAVIEEKPEVRKAGGVYYTPQYIVNYIVENTIGEMLRQAQQPEEIAKLKICDPACGSGSFLVGAYQYLLNYHLDYYTKDKNIKKALKEGIIYQVAEKNYKLTIEEKQKILINNIYGVDIDPQAVEVTKLSLYLKLLENEGKEAEGFLFKHSDFKLLPTLDNNIKCGNSLIGSDFYTSTSLDTSKSLFPDIDTMRKVNVFDWEREFPEVFTSAPLSERNNINSRALSGVETSGEGSGFDVVIGNPPYSYMISDEEQKYFQSKYKYQDYQKDLYLLFLEKYHFLLKQNGLLGIIISNTWLQSVTYKKIRQYLSNEYCWKKILHLPEKVFDAVVDTHVLIFEKNKNNNCDFTVEEFRNKEISFLHILNMSNIAKNGDSINIVSNSNQQNLFNEIKQKSILLKEIADIYNGVKPFEKGKGKPPQTEKTMKEKPFVKEGDKPSGEWSPLLRGSLINRYINLWNNNYWILYGEWLAAPRNPEIFNNPKKIMIRQTGDSLIGTIITNGFIARNNLHIVIAKDQKYNLNYFLGIINSKLLDYYYSIMNPEKGEALAEVKKDHVEQLPIKPIDFSNPTEKQTHDKLVSLVDQMLGTQKQFHEVKSDSDKKMFKMKIDMIDRQIDEMVFNLYGLSEEEIRIVEGEK
jgi:adenine-specific DNA-methyltransferase